MANRQKIIRHDSKYKLSNNKPVNVINSDSCCHFSEGVVTGQAEISINVSQRERSLSGTQGLDRNGAK